MGAFGELLIQRWGGNLEVYRNAGSSNSNKIEPIVETTEEDKERFRRERVISHARVHLDSLTSNLIYMPDEVVNFTEESVKAGFKKLGYGIGIQNIMWKEYCSFVKKYIKKS